MSEMQSYAGQSLLRDSRRAARTLSRYEARTQVRVASTDSETDVSLAKVESVTTVTGGAMAAVTRVAQVQKQLEGMAPEVSGRLSMLADGHAIACYEITTDHQRFIRRR